jgi:RNA polymerase sigma factor (sigma-70 family)
LLHGFAVDVVPVDITRAVSMFSLALRLTLSAAVAIRPVPSSPPSLDRLLHAKASGDAELLDAGWRAFVDEHTRLLLHVARSVSSSHDEAMDAYAFVLEQLRVDDFRRLREFAADPRSRLSTWLVVVARRLCLDLYRRRYGRARDRESLEQRAIRRRVQDLIAEDVDLNELPATATKGAELALRRSELIEALEQAMAALAPSDRLLLQLRFDEDLTAQEIARLLSFASPFHVYRRVNALLAALRRSLAERGIESAVP